MRGDVGEPVTATNLAERAWDLSIFDGHKHCLVISFRRSGRAVATPVWFGRDGDRLCFLSDTDAGKVKRLRRNPRVLIAPCTFAGQPKGARIEGHVRFLDAREEEVAERVIAANVAGFLRRLYYRTIGPKEVFYFEVREAGAA